MLWYYSRKEPIDLMIEGHIVDAGGNYLLVTYVILPTMLSIYCALGKWFDADYIFKMLEKLVTSQKLNGILQKKFERNFGR